MEDKCKEYIKNYYKDEYPMIKEINISKIENINSYTIKVFYNFKYETFGTINLLVNNRLINLPLLEKTLKH